MPTLDDCAAALKEPARPLFLGRKSCPPSEPLVLEIVEAESLMGALAASPLTAAADRGDDGRSIRVMFPASEAAAREDEERPVTDTRDWRSGVHGGGRLVRIRALPAELFATLPAAVRGSRR